MKYDLKYNQAQMAFAEVPWQEGNDQSNVINNGKIIDAIDTLTNGITRYIKTNDNKLI